MTGPDYVHSVTGEVVAAADFDPLERDELQYQRRAVRPTPPRPDHVYAANHPDDPEVWADVPPNAGSAS